MRESTLTKSLNQREFLTRVFKINFQKDLPFAIWRKPKSDNLELVLGSERPLKKVNLELEELPAGFIVHPFGDQENQEAFFIDAANYIQVKLDQPISPEDLPEFIAGGSENKDELNSIFEWFQKTKNGLSPESNLGNGESQKHYENLVKLGIKGIEKGDFEKVVPARTKRIPLDSSFDLMASFETMLKKYPNAFVNFFHLPGIGTWLGASPEILIETKQDHFYTMSLAGTQPASGDNPVRSVAWTQKEIEEQALVSRYIVDCFKKIRLREYEEHGPKTVQAGSLLHLRSDFKVDMKATNFPQLGSVMLKLLHPTSAVCGMPRQKALDFIAENEQFDRSFFAGFLGPVNIGEETSIYVNLRTASLTGKEAIVYAGAGITEDSDPEKEWEETELKCANIGKILINPKE
ncbi:chorismate-binding protein [Algoriphagus sediminis]|uniref:isochorismate synthase n=1 Tax=Algoriphagus sediminis TaxID=3057113 RepID=A0ABT7Y803_9BACT|nr:chorismate-binding protein [Algoriphagus sediminis]MDN3202632.1 chorismate-binding protein [Algoriphagus sediminis]